jgi:hypothetical protein
MAGALCSRHRQKASSALVEEDVVLRTQRCHPMAA